MDASGHLDKRLTCILAWLHEAIARDWLVAKGISLGNLHAQLQVGQTVSSLLQNAIILINI